MPIPKYIDSSVKIGKNTIVEGGTIIQKNAKIGSNCKIHRHIYIDEDVVIGDCVKIQDNVMIPQGVCVENGVFIGPSVAFTNDLYPRAINKNGLLKNSTDWEVRKTIIKYGASIGANATILCGITIGEWAMIGAGAVVTKDVPPHTLVVGNPAKIIRRIDF